LTFPNLPTQAAIGNGGAEVYTQVTNVTLTFQGTVGGNPFIFVPTGCQVATSTLTAQTRNESAAISAPSSYLPTGC
jgi:hypothetical protein